MGGVCYNRIITATTRRNQFGSILHLKKWARQVLALALSRISPEIINEGCMLYFLWFNRFQTMSFTEWQLERFCVQAYSVLLQRLFLEKLGACRCPHSTVHWLYIYTRLIPKVRSPKRWVLLRAAVGNPVAFVASSTPPTPPTTHART
jgi:hypothetical protein